MSKGDQRFRALKSSLTERDLGRGRLTKRAFWRHVTTSSGRPLCAAEVIGLLVAAIVKEYAFFELSHTSSVLAIE
jgi:hypothetical protein